MFDGGPYKDELKRRLASILLIVDASHPAVPAVPDISREARGLAILLLFAAYENLLTSLCRGLLEKAASLRVGNRRLKPGIQLFAVYPQLQAISTLPAHRIWKDKGRHLVELMQATRECTVGVDLFPIDGSFMKSTQVHVFCTLFDLGDPGPILKEVWGRLDTIVTQRNRIAHGAESPEEVGKRYTIQELRTLVQLWEQRWCEFVDHVERKASTRDFYRTRR